MSQQPDYGMPVHPVCDLFPLMDATSLAGLAADIKANGLLNPVVLHEGHIVDGRNRLLACRTAGVQPRFSEWRETYTGNMPVDAWIWSLNVERRHLTPDQIAWAVVQRRAWQERQAAHERQAAAGKQFHKGSPKVPRLSGEPLPARRNRDRETNRILAKDAGVSRNKIDQAIAVQKLAKDQKIAPEITEQLRQGTVKLREVLRQKVPVAATAPAMTPLAATAAKQEDAGGRTKRQKVRGAAAKRRMVEALSQVNGFCRGLSGLDASAIARLCTVEETETWAGIARNAAKELRLFSSRLLALAKESKE